MEIVTAITALAGTIGSIAADLTSGKITSIEAQRRTDAAYATYRQALAGIGAGLAQNDAEADALLASLPSKSAAPGTTSIADNIHGPAGSAPIAPPAPPAPTTVSPPAVAPPPIPPDGPGVPAGGPSPSPGAGDAAPHAASGPVPGGDSPTEPQPSGVE